MSLLDMMDVQVARDESAALFRWWDQGVETVLSRVEFRDRARAIAAHLREVSSPGDRVLMVYPPGPDFLCAFVGALSAGTIAVPVYPPDGRPRSVERFLALIADSGAKVAVGTAEVCAMVGAVPELARLRWLATDTIPTADAVGYRPVPIGDDTVAFIQYTSGSTGTPRGVIHTHGNVLSNIQLIRETFKIDAASRGVIWLPLYHDMGLIASLMSLRDGNGLTLMSPLAFLRDPIEWLRTISRTQATHSGGPNFAYDLCVRKVKATDLEGLDLSSWSLAFNGAEPVRSDTLERFADTFAPCGFRREALLPCYGLAEATLLVCGGPAGGGFSRQRIDEQALSRGRFMHSIGKKSREMVASGQVLSGTDVRIVDPTSCVARPAGEIGEIWVRGPGLGRGYWQRAEETERTFCARIEPSGDGPYLRTGDLGVVVDGQIYVTGRIKDVIVINGHNYYPQDIESAVMGTHSAIRPGCTAAVALSGEAGEEVALFVEVDALAEDPSEAARVVTAVRERVSEVCALSPAVVLVLKRGTLPKTSSGKLQRSASRDAFLRGELTSLAAHDGRRSATTSTAAAAAPHTMATLIDALEARLLEEIENIIGRKIEASAIVTRLGITSISAIEIMFAIEQEFGKPIAPEYLADAITVRELARRIATGEKPAPLSAPRTAKPACATPARKAVDLSLMYFSTDTLPTATRYDILLRTARFADDHGFRALWIPERHFHAFGGAYPNPAVVASALAMHTKRIRLRAGSVVLPLHNPVRVAEDWSLIDNLSGGRVDISFATGWNPNDFVIAPDSYEARRAITMQGISQVQALWSGQSLELRNGRGNMVPTTIHPRALQPRLTTWLTCTASVEGFVDAGEAGHNVLTALLFQRPEDLAAKIELYRAARARAGHDPEAGTVTLMLHTFVGRSMESVQRKVAGPFKRYLASSIDLWKSEWPDLVRDGGVTDEMLEVAFHRYARGSALFGTPASCAELVTYFRDSGVNEIAALIDFGVEADDVLESLVYLDDMHALLGAQQERSGGEAIASAE